MNKTKEESIDFILESKEESNGKFSFTAESLTLDFECEKVLERISKNSKNKDLVWRHRHPIDPEHTNNHIYGFVKNSEVKNGKILTEYETYSHTKDHENFINIIKETINIGDPIGISLRYRKYYDDDDNIIHVDVFENSITPYPKCEECRTIDYIGENKNMSEKQKVDESKETKNDKIDIEAHLKKIEELEKTLNSKTEALEGYKTKIETLEKEVAKEKDSKKSETKSLEDRVKSLEEKLENQEKTHKAEIEYLNKKPILDEMFESKDLDEDEKKFYKSLSLEKLTKKRDQWAKESEKPFTKTMDESANEAQEKAKDEKDEKDKAKPLTKEMINEFVKDERMRSIMYKVIEKNQDKK